MVIVDTLIHPLQVLLSFQGGPTDAAQLQGLWEFLGGTSSSGTTVPNCTGCLTRPEVTVLLLFATSGQPRSSWCTFLIFVYICVI